jgi:hypothetical protein
MMTHAPALFASRFFDTLTPTATAMTAMESSASIASHSHNFFFLACTATDVFASTRGLLNRQHVHVAKLACRRCAHPDCMRFRSATRVRGII